MELDRVFLPSPTETEKINAMIIAGAAAMTDRQIVAQEITDFLRSQARKMMLVGERYYKNTTDIQKKKRLLSDGIELKFRANTKLEHAFYRKIVDQITGYLTSKLPTISPTNKEDNGHAEALAKIFDRAFWRVFHMATRAAINHGIAWINPYIDQDGALKWAYIPGFEVCPLWKDNAHTESDGIIRIYDVATFEGKTKKTVSKSELHTLDGVQYFIYDNGTLRDDIDMAGRKNGSFIYEGKPHVWTRLPLIPIRYNDIEQPLIEILKSNIDTYNMAASVHADTLADIGAALIWIEGYGGDPDKMLHNIFQMRIAQLQIGGKIGKLDTEPQTESVETMLTRIRRDIFSFGAGVDGQDDGQNNRSGVALQEKRSDLDTICNIFENELQDSMQQIIWFAHEYMAMTGAGDYREKDVTVTFNRDIVTNEAEAVEMLKNSVGLISNRTIVTNHPLTEDADAEIAQMKTEQDEEQKRFEEQQARAVLNDPYRKTGGAINGDTTE